jgi:hypothetical protein
LERQLKVASWLQDAGCGAMATLQDHGWQYPEAQLFINCLFSQTNSQISLGKLIPSLAVRH